MTLKEIESTLNEEQLLRFRNVIERLKKVIKEEAIARWVQTPNKKAFQDRTPLELIKMGGAEFLYLENVLYHLESGEPG